MLRAEDVKEEFLVCCICTKEFDEEIHIPRVLPCLHTFCQACLRKTMKENTLTCPYCKTGYILPSEGIYVFPKDSTRRSLTEFLKVRKRSSDLVCKDCPDDNNASDFCKECCIFMCVECTRAHKRSLASRGHVVLDIQQLQHTGPEVFQRKLKCLKPGHEGQYLAFYCSKKGCEELVCTACTVCDHDRTKGHTIQNVKDIQEQKKNELTKIFNVLEEDVKTAKLLIQQTEQEMLNLDIKEFEIEKEIDAAFDECHKIIDARKSELKEKVSGVCENRKSFMQSRTADLETFVDDIASAQEFCDSIFQHTDPTEFIPLHLTLYRRLKVLTGQKIKKSLEIESPIFDPMRMNTDLQRMAKNMGQIATTVHTRKITLARGQTDVTSTVTPNLKLDGDSRHGDIFCPGFGYDPNSVHQYRELGDNMLTLKNQANKQNDTELSEGRLVKYRGAIASRSFQHPGKYYFEVIIDYQIHKQLDNANFIFEIGFVSRKNDIDQGHYVYDNGRAWSFCAQQCEEHSKLCLWCRHNGRNLAHAPLSSADADTKMKVTFGFLLDMDHKKMTILDLTNERKIFTFSKLEVTRPLWLVLGCHWPSKIKIEMTLSTGSNISKIPNFHRSQ